MNDAAKNGVPAVAKEATEVGHAAGLSRDDEFEPWASANPLLEPPAGPGRPAPYCGSQCKRVAEFEVRRLDRRLGQYYEVLREEQADRMPAFGSLDRQSSSHARSTDRRLRRWIAKDERRLRELVGGSADV